MTSRVTRRRATTRRRAAAAALLAATTVGALLTTSALFTDEETISDNIFTSGTIDLTLNPTTQRFNVPTMMPGDAVTAPITVNNSGTSQLRYAVSSTTTGDSNLASVLLYNIKSDVTDCSTTGFSASGTAVATAAPLTNANLIGSAQPGNHAGDRTLAATASEVLCVQVYLPLSTGNTGANGATLTGKSTTAILTFNAEQTANN
jgi:spore coat-associated protein N